MSKKSTIQIVITVLLAVIAAALTILVLEKAGVISCSKDVRSNTEYFHRNEEVVHAHHAHDHHGHEHTPDCGHNHKHEEHKHSADCGHSEKKAEHKHKEHKHSADCGHSAKKAEHNHKH